jgi:xylulokinase
MTGFSLGIDLGTTSVKVIALDRDGTVLDSASSHHGIEETPDGVQADAAQWWSSLLAALSGLTVDLADARTVGFSGNMSSVVLVDDELHPLHPALLLADARGAEEIARLDDDTVAEIIARTGNLPQSVFSLSSLLWFRDQRPQLLARAAAWLSAKDYLRGRLTGVAGSDVTDAYNSLMLTSGVWNEDLISRLQLPLGLFPSLFASGDEAGRITAEASQLTGLPIGTPVAAGAGDVAASISGFGGLPHDAISISLGTSATVMAALPDRDVSAAAVGRLTVHPTAEGSLFALGSLLTGGLALNWLRSLVGTEPIARASSVPAESELFFLPYLAGTGSPDFIPEARGTLFGISPATTGSDMVSALVEAIAFDVADLVELLGAHDYRRVLVSGGGSRIGAWPQVIADVIGLPVQTLDAPDLSAVGAAVLGWRAIGIPVAAATTGAEILPRQEHAAAWAARRARYASARRTALDYYTDHTP